MIDSTHPLPGSDCTFNTDDSPHVSPVDCSVKSLIDQQFTSAILPNPFLRFHPKFGNSFPPPSGLDFVFRFVVGSVGLRSCDLSFQEIHRKSFWVSVRMGAD